MVDGEFFDLLITDQTMPGMTGLELIKALRGAGCQTPAILSSGYGVQLEGAELEQLGQIQLVHKPFTSEGLSIALISTLKLQPCPV